MPLTQVQYVEPFREVEFPGHSRHSSPSELMYVPSLQEQLVDPAGEVELAGQEVQEEESLTLGSGE